MNLDDLKDQLKEIVNSTRDRIEESQIYNNIIESYQTLSSTMQKSIIVGVSILITLIVLSIPYSYISSSSDTLTYYEDEKHAIRELLKVSRMSGSGPILPTGISASDLQNQAQGIVAQFQLLPEQIGQLADLSQEYNKVKIAQPPIIQQAVGIELKKLNLSQIIDIGYRFQTINPSIKLIGIEIKDTAEKANYYDAVFKLIGFALPDSTDTKDTKKRKGDK